MLRGYQRVSATTDRPRWTDSCSHFYVSSLEKTSEVCSLCYESRRHLRLEATNAEWKHLEFFQRVRQSLFRSAHPRVEAPGGRCFLLAERL
jgi:hypothetical protein